MYLQKTGNLIHQHKEPIDICEPTYKLQSQGSEIVLNAAFRGVPAIRILDPECRELYLRIPLFRRKEVELDQRRNNELLLRSFGIAVTVVCCLSRQCGHDDVQTVNVI